MLKKQSGLIYIQPKHCVLNHGLINSFIIPLFCRGDE